MKILKNLQLTLVLASILISFFPVYAQTAAETFNPNFIIGDQEVLDNSAMTQEEVRNFINGQGGFLSTYSTNSCTPDDIYNPDGKYKPCTGPIMSAADIIYDRAVTNKVNPKFLIVLLQKESSLVESSKIPSQIRLDWAVGYGCPDNSACNPRWQGFWRQINSASLTFRDYMDNPGYYRYKAGGTYTLTNTGREPMTVTPANQATAALYNYTPHVYNGNYNFYVIWQRYFSRNNYYPNGSLLQAEGEIGVWLIQNGTRRAFTSYGALSSRYDTKKILKVTKSDLNKYPKGDPIKFPQYSIVRTPDGSIYLINDDQKRLFASNSAFKKIGINPEEIIGASWDDMKSYRDGSPITATSTYATGALLQNNRTGGIYWVIDGTKSALLDPAFLKTKFKNKKIVKASPAELDTYKTIEPVLFGDGELLKSPISSAVFVISDGKKNPITSGKDFESLGYKWENVITVSPKVLYRYSEGNIITEMLANRQTSAQAKTGQTATTIKTTSQPAAATIINKTQIQ